MKRQTTFSFFCVSLVIILGLVLQLQQSHGQELPDGSLVDAANEYPFSPIWMTERIASGKTFENLTDRALATDSQGRLHVVYGGEYLYYALYDGEWHYETLPTPLGSGEWASIAVDAFGNPHIAFHYSISSYAEYSGQLMYAQKSAADWEITVVETTNNSGLTTSIALDSHNRPHISYVSHDSATMWLKYANLTAQGWQTEEIETVNFYNINHTSIAVDSLNQPHISYSIGNRDTTDDSIKYATKSNNIWQVASVAQCDIWNTSCLSSIAVDSQDRVHIAYHNNDDYNIYHLVKEGSGWQSAIVDQDVTHSYGLTTKVSLNLDQNDVPRVTYVDLQGYASANEPIRSELRLAQLTNSTWVTKTLATFPWQVLGSYNVSISAANENTYALYFDKRGLELNLATVDSNDIVVLETLDRNHVYSDASQLEAYSQDEVHVLFNRENGFYPTYNEPLLYTSYQSSQWISSELDDANHYTLVVDNQGNPHIAYYKTSYDANSETTQRTLRYGFWNGSSWVFADLPSVPERWFTPRLQLDSQGDPHIFNEGSIQTDYIKRHSGVWITGTISADVSIQELTFDSTDQVHGVYFDSEINELLHAQWGGSEIITETITSSDAFINVGAFALDGNDIPHVLYTENDGKWHYASKLMSGWVTELLPVDSVGDGVGWYTYTNVDLDFGKGMIPHIIYTDLNGTFAHFYKQNNVWTATELGFDLELAWEPSIDVDMNGRPTVSFMGDKDGDMFFAWPEWEHEIAQTGGHYYVYNTAEIVFPTDVLDEAINLRFIPQEYTENAAEPIMTFAMESTGVRSQYPVTVTGSYQLSVNYDEHMLPIGTNEENLGLGYWDGSEWITVNAVVNVDTNQIEATLNHFGTFAILENHSSVQANGNIFLPFVSSPFIDISIGSILTPFDANIHDLNGPSSWSANYGKTPEIIVASNGTGIDVLAQDYNDETPWNAVLLHLDPTPTGYAVTQLLTDLPMLDRIMGLAIDEAGNRYYATAVDEGADVNAYYPPLNTYRSNIVRIIKVNPAGEVQFNVDLDIARGAYNDNAEMIVNPMVAATARLAVGGNEIALVHGNNTDPDWNINGTRHQKALSTRLNATDGTVTRVSSIWVSHSFDQRLFYDGNGIVENHLGDAFPRYVAFGRDHVSYPLFHIKGAIGENLTATRLGNIALIENDPTYGYIGLFSTETTATTGNIFDSKINGPRNLAIVRINLSDNSLDPTMPDTLTVSSAGVQHTNQLRWLTNYTENSNLHAERPKLIGIGNDQYIVLWEEWHSEGNQDTFNGIYGMVIDANGDILRASTLITETYHLHRGDDAFLLDGKAAWMTGNASRQELRLHLVDAFLNYEMITID